MKTITKKAKPKFKRQDFQLKKLKDKWKRPKGLHSKLRLRKSGHQKKPNIGYKNPKEIRGLFLSKFKFTKVGNFKDLEKAKEDKNIILSKIGKKKKIGIIERALELKLNILNIKDPQGFIKKIKEEKERKIEKKERKEIKEEKKKEMTKEEKEKKEKELKKKVLEGKKTK